MSLIVSVCWVPAAPIRIVPPTYRCVVELHNSMLSVGAGHFSVHIDNSIGARPHEPVGSAPSMLASVVWANASRPTARPDRDIVLALELKVG